MWLRLRAQVVRLTQHDSGAFLTRRDASIRWQSVVLRNAAIGRLGLMPGSTAGSDDYGEEDYEAESPIASIEPPQFSDALPLHSASLTAGGDDEKGEEERAALPVEDRHPSTRVMTRLLGENNEVNDDNEDDDGDFNTLPKSLATSPSRISGRHVLENALWTYSIEATRVRALRIPIVDSTALQDLRMFAIIDKQARQSRGSIWKADVASGSRRQSSLSARSSRSLESRQSSSRHRQSPSASPGGRGISRTSRRSGLLEEAKWTPGDGALHWTLTMEKLRHLKAYSPRIKVFLYGVDIGTTNTPQKITGTKMQNTRRQSDRSSADVLSLGWLFLDLRTPDLPLRWLKLQNAKYGGEIQIQTSIRPLTSHDDRDTSTTRGRVARESVPEEIVLARPSKAATTTMGAEYDAKPRVQRLNQQVVVDDSGDFLQLGSRNGTDVFVVSVAINAARNLSELARQAMSNVDQSKVVTARDSGFWLSYSLFDVVVQTDVFHNLETAEFPSIRDCFRVRSCIEDMRAFIDASHGVLPVYLCTNNQLIAGATIPLCELLQGDLFSDIKDMPKPGTTASIADRFSFMDSEHAYVEAEFSIELANTSPFGHQKDDINASEKLVVSTVSETNEEATRDTLLPPKSSSTVVKIALESIRLSNALLAPFVGTEGVVASITTPNMSKMDSLCFCGFGKDFAVARVLQAKVETVIKTEEDRLVNAEVIFSTSSSRRELAKATIDLSKELAKRQVDLSDSANSTLTALIRDQEDRPAGECSFVLSVSSEEEPGIHTNADERGMEEERHLYRLSLQIKAIRDAVNPGTFTIGFDHPFHKGIQAYSQPVLIPAKQEVNIRDSVYCASELSMSSCDLKNLMGGVVTVQLLEIGAAFDSKSSRNEAIFSLNYLFYSQERFCCPNVECRSTFETRNDTLEHYHEIHCDSNITAVSSPNDIECASIKSCSIYVPVIRNSSEKKQPQRIALIRIDATLEDFGSKSATRTTRITTSLVPESVSIPKELISELESPPNRLNLPSHHRSSSCISGTDDDEFARKTVDTGICAAGALHPPPAAIPSSQSGQTNQFEQEAARQLTEQTREWKKKLAAAERSRMGELEREWARREEERAELLRAAQHEYENLELKLRNALADVEARERRLAIAEAALEREQRDHRDEMDSLRRKLSSEQSHAVALANQQRDALDQRVLLLEGQLAKAEEQVREVENDYAEYRKQQRKVPEARLREEIAALKGKIAELERQKLAEERAKHEAIDAANRLRLQLEHANHQVQEERKKHETHVVEELEKLRLKYVAREEKYVLDGDREELRAIKLQLDELRGIQEKAVTGPMLAASSVHSVRRRHNPLSSVDVGPSPKSPQIWNRNQSSRRSRDEWRSAGEDHIRLHADQTSPINQDGQDTWPFQVSLDSSEVEYGRHDRLQHQVRQRQRRSVRSRSSGSSGSAINDFSDAENASPHQNSRYFVSSASAVEAMAPASIASIAGPSESRTVDQELKRLQNERELLLASGTYDSKSYLVRELDRLIANVRSRARL